MSRADDYGYFGCISARLLAFGGDIMNRKVGHRFRDVILANGGQVPAQVLVKKFLGREPSNKALFAEITGMR